MEEIKQIRVVRVTYAEKCKTKFKKKTILFLNIKKLTIKLYLQTQNLIKYYIHTFIYAHKHRHTQRLCVSLLYHYESNLKNKTLSLQSIQFFK